MYRPSRNRFLFGFAFRQALTKNWSLIKHKVKLNFRRPDVQIIFTPSTFIHDGAQSSTHATRGYRNFPFSRSLNTPGFVGVAPKESRELSGITLDMQDLADPFQVTRSRARKVLCAALSTPKFPHRPPTLTLEQTEAACQLIRNAASTGNFVTSRQLLNSIETEFRKTLTYGWAKSFFRQSAHNVKQVVVSPQELPRLQIPRRYLNEYIILIQQYVPLVPAELIFEPR
jgi:hypothetical protein